MFRSVFVLLVIALFCQSAVGQDGCPTISVLGPSEIVPVGEIAKYIAVVGGTEDEKHRLEYSWTVSSGAIVRGQGTTSIEVRQPNQSLTVTVEVIGLPKGCSYSASEVCCGHPPPQPVKLAEYVGKPPSGLMSDIVKLLAAYPSDQLYILSGHFRGKASATSDLRERELLAYLSSAGINPDRITLASVFADTELIQIWRVPPGAENPRCFTCEELEKEANQCPTIMVTGPAGIVGSDGVITFTATVSGNASPDMGYVWSIRDGRIIRGQGTPELRAQYRSAGVPVTATLTVTGLSIGCTNTASDTYPNIVDPGPEQLGRIRNSTYTINTKLLDTIARSLRQNPNSQLYVWVYYGSSEDKFAEIKTHLVRQLSATKIDKSRFTIVGSSLKNNEAVFWHIRPGVENPSP